MIFPQKPALSFGPAGIFGHLVIPQQVAASRTGTQQQSLPPLIRHVHFTSRRSQRQRPFALEVFRSGNQPLSSVFTFFHSSLLYLLDNNSRMWSVGAVSRKYSLRFMYPILWTFLFLGLALIVAVLEVFLPSGGVLAVLAIAFLITSVVFSFQTDIVFGSFYTLFTALLVPAFLWVALIIWPNTWIGRQILLIPEEDPALVPDEEQRSLKQLIGKQGLAKSKMLLGGLIEIENKRYSAVSDAEPIEPGEVISVIRIEGTSIIVRKSTVPVCITSAETASPDDPFA